MAFSGESRGPRVGRMFSDGGLQGSASVKQRENLLRFENEEHIRLVCTTDQIHLCATLEENKSWPVQDMIS